MNLEQLLEQWAGSIEPERCFLTIAGEASGKPLHRYCIPLDGKDAYYWGGSMSQAHVLAAVMEAIEARGMRYQIGGYMLAHTKHQAYVWPDELSLIDSDACSGYSNDSPVIALLAAYLQALKTLEVPA